MRAILVVVTSESKGESKGGVKGEVKGPVRGGPQVGTGSTGAPGRPPRPEADDPVADAVGRLRELCLARPEVTEKLSHGEPTWFVRRAFVMFAGHHHDDRVALWCAAAPGVQQELVAAAPQRFFRPPYVGGRGWVGVWLDVADVDWVEIDELVLDAYRAVAPRKLVALLDP